MSTNLFPSTTNVSLTEQLAGVPLGTVDRLHDLEVKHMRLDTVAQDYTTDRTPFYTELEADSDLDCLYTFNCSGWGRLSPAAMTLIESWGFECGLGGTNDKTRIYKLLLAQGVQKPGTVAARVDAICWA